MRNARRIHSRNPQIITVTRDGKIAYGSLALSYDSEHTYEHYMLSIEGQDRISTRTIGVEIPGFRFKDMDTPFVADNLGIPFVEYSRDGQSSRLLYYDPVNKDSLRYHPLITIGGIENDPVALHENLVALLSATPGVEITESRELLAAGSLTGRLMTRLALNYIPTKETNLAESAEEGYQAGPAVAASWL